MKSVTCYFEFQWEETLPLFARRRNIVKRIVEDTIPSPIFCVTLTHRFLDYVSRTLEEGIFKRIFFLLWRNKNFIKFHTDHSIIRVGDIQNFKESCAKFSLVKKLFSLLSQSVQCYVDEVCFHLEDVKFNLESVMLA